MEDNLLEGLNEQQRQAVLINDGSLLVFAGAGSGKTRVITTKIAYSMQNLGIQPYRILAVTFTNKACKEMQERVEKMTDAEQYASKPMIRTFHSFGVWLLRKYGHLIGLADNFKIYDDDDSATLLCQCFPDDQKKDVKAYARKISTLKDKMQKPNPLDEKLCKYYARYQEKLQSTGNVDFADMILKSIQLLRTCPEVKQKIHDRFKVILVDEYQDSNTAQFLLLKELAAPDAFVCVVGDDDQSIYRFRGAEVKNILEFPNAFPNTKTVVLGTNYRCTASILDVASDVIGHNGSRAPKNLNAAKGPGVKPVLTYVNSEYDEAQEVVNILKRLPRKELNSCAVLYRTNAQSKTFEDKLMFNGLPYHIVGSLRFYDREEIRDCIALISLEANPRDPVAFERMVNKPSRGIGQASLEKVMAFASESNDSIIDSCRKALSAGIVRGLAAAGLSSFLEAFDSCASEMGHLPNADLLKLVLDRFGLMDYYRRRDQEEGTKDGGRVDNLNQMVNMLSSPEFAEGMEGISNFLEYIALDPSSLGKAEGSSEEGVTLITMHNTKGLEYSRVFVAGMEDELFPGLRDEDTQADLEEERRICYVAFTRAKDQLYLYSCRSRMMWGQKRDESPSRFISEIAKDHLEVVDKRQTQRTQGWYDFNSNRQTQQKSWSGTRSYGYPQSQGWKSQGQKPLVKPVGSSTTSKPAVVLVKKPAAENRQVAGPATPQDFKIGDRLSSQFYGLGTVVAMRKVGGRDVMDVKFDSGKTGSFACGRTNFEKVKS